MKFQNKTHTEKSTTKVKSAGNKKSAKQITKLNEYTDLGFWMEARNG